MDTVTRLALSVRV
ncbi:hypothetical protein F383_12795 [Gossypium arboreum]|uniref:Uncharacterized protein n=1 Tax=Gossypium arboreum TaxID=29729 RepID=A0A0B0M687_GOSAR|nr:hypothetical protein F383_36720 [Gossypium arboreum]KHG20632.1 hypothetical protein F383_24020 [Gossypium arboreum]KHG23293.1 hypothetical protein F383_03233 [Gossypium arboreum]KHG24631.1 hypothetical protein F383_31240 [Gossypium arboreum]KHG27194.1 hypothetical protein F383_33971 [Gossypium arboreum]